MEYTQQKEAMEAKLRESKTKREAKIPLLQEIVERFKKPVDSDIIETTHATPPNKTK